MIKIQIVFAKDNVVGYNNNLPMPRIGEYIKSTDGEGRVEDIHYIFNEHEISGNNRIIIYCTKDY